VRRASVRRGDWPSGERVGNCRWLMCPRNVCIAPPKGICAETKAAPDPLVGGRYGKPGTSPCVS